jgi:signal transduction histidine kinase
MLIRQVGQAITDLPESADDGPGRGSNERLQELAARLSEAGDQYVQLMDAGQVSQAREALASRVKAECVEPMRRALTEISLESDSDLRRTAAAVGESEGLVTTILAVNAVLAFLLAAAGVHLVRNWVLKPIGALMTAAEQHASGNLEHRIEHIPPDELGTLSREVNRMADSLIRIQQRLLEQERMAAIGEVTSTVAHNIRNPLAGIRAEAQSSMIDLSETSELAARQTTIVKMVDSLNRWLRELLQVSQPIELDCRSVRVAELVARVTDVLRASAERRGVRFVVDECPPGCLARVDPPRLEQAILTVVDNALDASPAGAEVRIETGGRWDGWIEVRVVDRGPGIPPEVLSRVASPYFSTKPGGTGIGLYLAKRVVQAHGGTLEFQSDADTGTTVIMRLPAATDSAQGA